MRACLVANVRDLTGIPTLIGLAKKVSLVEVSDKELREEATRLYDNVDRLRAILNGCDPKLVRELMAARDQSYSPTDVSDSATQSLPLITIFTCNGRSSHARFRSAPTMADWAILGEIAHGDQVYLTRHTYRADGVIWHKVITPSVVAISNKQVAPNQTGWIADCFVR